MSVQDTQACVFHLLEMPIPQSLLTAANSPSREDRDASTDKTFEGAEKCEFIIWHTERGSQTIGGSKEFVPKRYPMQNIRRNSSAAISMEC